MVEYRNLSGIVLSTYDSGYYFNTNFWQYIADTRIAPVGTRTIRIRIFSKRDDTNGGTNSDGYHDGMSLVALTLLPIELIDFHVVECSDKIQVNWRTASETQNTYFTVQHSTHDVLFRDLAQVPGNGDSKVENSYAYLHENPAFGTNYYRLKVVDFNGNFEYSPLVSVDFKANQDGIRVYPNPFSDEIQIDIDTDSELGIPARIYDSNGCIVWQGRLLREVQSLNLQALQGGLFWLELDFMGQDIGIMIVKK